MKPFYAILLLLTFLICVLEFEFRETPNRHLDVEARDSGRLFVYEFYNGEKDCLVIGYGEVIKNVFIIRDIDGRAWRIPKATKIIKSEVEEVSFKRRYGFNPGFKPAL